MLNCIPYIDFICEEANKINKTFIVDVGEGRDFIDTQSGWYVEDYSGWLINHYDVESFLSAQENGEEYDIFGNDYVFAIWSILSDGKIKVFFKYY